jgi:hypothetical protein
VVSDVELISLLLAQIWNKSYAVFGFLAPFWPCYQDGVAFDFGT